MTPEEQRLYDRCAEALAKYAHDAWSAYMSYFLSNLTHTADLHGNLTIPAEYVNALYRLTTTPYHELSYEEQLSDQAEADKILAILKEILV